MREKNYEFIEHTADIGIKVKGRNLKELFKNAAVAMFDIIAQKNPHAASQKPQTKEIFIRQEAFNLDELFINWLNELLSLSAAKDLIITSVKIEKIDEKNIEAVAKAESSTFYKINTEIKAATYHELKIEKIDNNWQAKVIFDV